MPTFSPRTYPLRFGIRDRLWARFSYGRGYAVLKTGSSYVEYQDVSTEAVNAADITYLGGHTYTISTAEAAALTAAGYTTGA